MTKKVVKGKSAKEDDEPYIASKTGKEKKAKDGNHPKRPMSSYFFFLQERRPVLRKD